jgi:hypothetical protein
MMWNIFVDKQPEGRASSEMQKTLREFPVLGTSCRKLAFVFNRAFG